MAEQKQFLDKDGLQALWNKIIDEIDNPIQTQLTDLANQISALALGMKLSASVSPTIVEKGKTTTIKVTGTISNKPDSFTISEMTFNNSTNNVTINNNVGTFTETIALTANKTYSIIAKLNGMSFTASTTISARYPTYYGFDSANGAVPANGLTKLTSSLVTTAKQSYSKEQSADGTLNFFILVPSDVVKPSTFTMGGAPFAMTNSTTTYNINGTNVTYTVYKSEGIYPKNTKLNITAS